MGASESKPAVEIETDDHEMMWNTSSTPEINHILLIDGYLREIAETNIQRIIPNIINYLIKLFYPNFIVYGIGSNQNCHLGDHLGIIKYHLKKFTKLNTLSSTLTNIDGIYSGWKRIMIKDVFGELYGAGINTGGQLGFFVDAFDGDQCHESKEQIANFTKVPISDKINKPNISYFVELIVRRTFLVCNDESDNTQQIYVCGANFKGECVSQKIYNESTWRLIDNFIGHNDKIIEIKGGYYHTLFLTQSGQVWSCGDNEKGQCGVAVDVTNPNNNVIFEAHRVVFADKSVVKIGRIYCGTYYNFCIDDESGTIWIFGSNRHGQLGIDYLNEEIIDTPAKHYIFNGMGIRKFAMGLGYSACLDGDGNVYLFGVNECGQLGNGSCGNGNNVYNPYLFQSDERFEGLKIEQLECGGFHTVLLSEGSNEIITFGSNLSNQCSALRKKEYIVSPHVVSKRKEIGIGEEEYIEKIIAQSRSTLVVINKHKTFK